MQSQFSEFYISVNQSCTLNRSTLFYGVGAYWTGWRRWSDNFRLCGRRIGPQMSAYESKVRARVLVAHYTGDSFRRLSRNSQRRMGDTTVTPDERSHYGTRDRASNWPYSEYACTRFHWTAGCSSIIRSASLAGWGIIYNLYQISRGWQKVLSNMMKLRWQGQGVILVTAYAMTNHEGKVSSLRFFLTL